MNTEAKGKSRILFVTIGLIIGLIACVVALMLSGKLPQKFDSVTPEPTLTKEVKPSYYGVFIKQNSKLLELQELEIFSIPTEGEVIVSQTISDSQPVIVVWRQNLNLDYLELYKLNSKLGQPKNEIIYKATPKEDGVIEIAPAKPLDNGIYCLIQGDPFGVILPGWCFGMDSVSAGTTSTLSTTSSPSIEDFVGTWNNIDSEAGSWAKIEISVDGDRLFAHFWGTCGSSYCDAGITSAFYESNPVKLFIDHGFVIRNFTLLLSGDTLHVTTFSHYTDDSGREDLTLEDDFKK